MNKPRYTKKLGEGRSGAVFKIPGDSGKFYALKVFSGNNSLTKAVNYVLTGAPNAYVYDENAVICAHLRRSLLEILIPFWFDSSLRIAGSYGIAWNEDMAAYEMKTEFIEGRPAGLRHPFSGDTDWEKDDLVENIMKPLQEKLLISGFDGLAWQAGKGNPVALNNFLLDKQGRWVWIDAESGVPALFPLNIGLLFSFYIPKALKYRHVMFDDVDTGRLISYANEKRTQLENEIGAGKYFSLMRMAKALSFHQDMWRARSRAGRSIEYNLKKNRITMQQAEWYESHHGLWYGKQFLRFTKKLLFEKLRVIPLKIAGRLTSVNYPEAVKRACRFLFRKDYRKAAVESYLCNEIARWEKRGHMGPSHGAYLRGLAEQESVSPYLADSIILMGLKPFAYIVELVLLPSLYAAGFINEAVLVAAIALNGMLYRTVYTSGKMIYEFFRYEHKDRPPRFIALIVGLFPTAGNAAYLIQMIYSGVENGRELASFLLYNYFSMVGEKIPVWGGRDTATEHFFNHIPDIFIKTKPHHILSYR